MHPPCRLYRLRPQARGDEGGERRGVGGDAAAVHVVQHAEGLLKLVLFCKLLDVSVNDMRVFAVERYKALG